MIVAGKEMRFTLRHACLTACSCCCCTVLIIGIFVAIVWGNFEDPEFDVESVTPTKFDISGEEADVIYAVEISLDNPNGWPISGTLNDLTATIYSLDQDAADGAGEPLLMSTAYLPHDVDVHANTVTVFTVNMEFVAGATGTRANLFNRLWKDCKPAVSSPTTKIRVLITDVTATVLGLAVSLDGVNIPFDMVVSCDGLESPGRRNTGLA